MRHLILGHRLGVSSRPRPSDVLVSGLALALIPRAARVGVEKDWQAVSDAIKARLAELDMTQAELAQRAGVSLETVRELQHNLRPRRRNPRTLAAVSTALDWPEDRLAVIVAGKDPSGMLDADPVVAELAAIHAALAGISSRLDAIERKLRD